MNKATMRITSSLPIGFFKVRARRSGHHGRRRASSCGFSLVELLIAVALSLTIMTALIALFGNMSRTNNEMRKSNELIENGRFAIQLLQSDLAHAGFWGGIEELEATAVPNACLSHAGGEWPADTAALAEYKVNLMAVPVQGYAKGSNSLSSCGVTDAKVQANSSMLVVRHADTNTCVAGIKEADGGCDGGKDGVVVGPHLQVSGCESVVSPDAQSYVLDGVLASFTLRTKACDSTKPARLRKMISNIYYVGLSDGIPNLMRVSMKKGAYSEPEPLVEGIEALHVEYGIDNLGTNGKAISKVEPINPADGNADEYVTCPAAGCTLAQLENVVTVKLHILSRNLEPTKSYVNNTAYELGTGDTKLTIPAFKDAYKRHVFSTTVRLVNVSSPREPAV